MTTSPGTSASAIRFHHRGIIGKVSRVEPSRVELVLESDPSKGVAAHVGSYLVILASKYALFGQIEDIRVRTAGFGNGPGVEGGGSLATVELIATVDLEAERVIPGILQVPEIDDSAFAPASDFIQFVISGQGADAAKRANVTLELAELPEGETPVNVSPERLFGRHCAIIGATGGGKSWSLARIMEECARFRSKLVLIDATGEFRRLDHRVKHVHFGKDPDPGKESKSVALPYYHLTEQDLFAIFRPTGASQAPKLRAAIKSLKLAKVASSLGIDGRILKAHRSKKEYDRAYRHFKSEIDAPYATFDIRQLPQQIENECVDQQRSSTEPDVWGGTNVIDLSNCMPLIGRIHDMLQSPSLEPVFKPRKLPSLLEELHEFIRSPEHSVLRVNMQYLSSMHRTREIVANALGRHLYELGQRGAFKKHPLLVVIDEAHQFLKESLAADEEIPLDSFALIAKEGRKYAITTCIATQRPRDIPEDVLSQIGTMIVHRLINDRDRMVVERACGEVDQGSIKMIPTLAPGEALLAGVDFPVPLHIRVLEPKSRPHSQGANYQQFWKAD